MKDGGRCGMPQRTVRPFLSMKPTMGSVRILQSYGFGFLLVLMGLSV